MITYFRSYSVTASVRENRDGTAILCIKYPNSPRVYKTYKTKKNAIAAWKRISG